MMSSLSRSLENENKTLKDKSMSLERKCHNLELENKGNKNKLATLEVNFKRSQILLKTEKEMNNDVTAKVKSLSIELKTLKLKSKEQQNFQIEDCVACGGTREEILAFLPCLHAKTCKQCCKKILDPYEGAKKCPYCRVQVTEFKKVFV